ncbi:MAG: hypothetical protein LIP11_10215 [Clostridiales bacterium]|nr:hypothetical protein [Clostridiales bacterium]
MKKMTKWHLLLFVLAFLILCAVCIWYYMGMQASQPGNAELVRSENSLVTVKVLNSYVAFLKFGRE